MASQIWIPKFIIPTGYSGHFLDSFVLQYEPGITEGRISFTFRKLCDEATNKTATSESSSVPPIAPPPDGKTSCDRPKRVLFLTDSVLSNMPEYLFESVQNHVCIKKINYQLADIDNFSPEFAHSDIVIISDGINDLSRYGKTAETLADITTSRFREYAVRYPDTKFVLNSVLLTRDHPWLNREVNKFNSLMFTLAENTRNLYFFDSDRLMYKSNLKQRQIYATGYLSSGLSEQNMFNSQSNNGIHISLQARRMVTWQLVNAVGYLAGCRGPRFRSCEWLRCVTTRSSRAG